MFERPDRSDDVDREAPSTVVAAVAIGTAPLPIIGVYTVLFLVHGSIHPVQPPDVTASKTGEFIVGWISLAVFIALSVALVSFLNGRRRWPFAVMQLGILALCIDFATDDTVSGRRVSILVAVLSLAALVFAFTPSAWRYLGRPVPRGITELFRRGGSARPRLPGRRRRLVTADTTATTTAGSTDPTAVESGVLRRRHATDDSDATTAS